MVELLAPAGNYSKFQTAVHFGADAVYIGGKSFSLRVFSDNFTREELKKTVDEAHGLSKKVYVTVNIFAKNGDFTEMKDYLEFLNEIGVDAVIVSDPGIIYFIKTNVPNLCVHISTQANNLNKYTVKFWKEIGASRVILARELSIKEIKEIHDFVPDIELEAFVHGAMCISYSGRCFLSDYLDGRSSNRGACVQSCRWRYEIRAVNPSNGETGWLETGENGNGTFIMNSKDLNMMQELRVLEEAGVSSFKIEGRMKSEYYLATVINAYRRAIDNGYSQEYEDELCAISHRDYTKAYAYGENHQTVNLTDSQEKGTYTYIANAIKSENGYGIIEMRNRFKKGDILEILSSNDTFKKTFAVNEIYTSKGELVDDAKLVQEMYKISCPFVLENGDILRRRND